MKNFCPSLVVLLFVTKLCSAQSALHLDAGITTNAWVVMHQGQPLLRYAFNPREATPYVAEFSAPGGRNILWDAPSDHLHHHALMYAIKVNGLNFWEEVPGNGVERVVEVGDGQVSDLVGAWTPRRLVEILESMAQWIYGSS